MPAKRAKRRSVRRASRRKWCHTPLLVLAGIVALVVLFSALGWTFAFNIHIVPAASGPAEISNAGSAPVVPAKPVAADGSNGDSSTVSMSAADADPEANSDTDPIVTNDLVNPVLHHADSHPPEDGVGSFDVGVKNGQIGLAFGWHIAWPKGSVDAGGDGCDLVILTPGWYENLQVTDGRYEVYDVPSSDYSGWVGVLGQQRADEQANDYGCPAKSFSDLPQWKSPIPSPP